MCLPRKRQVAQEGQLAGSATRPEARYVAGIEQAVRITDMNDSNGLNDDERR